MTLYIAWGSDRHQQWLETQPPPPYQEMIFTGAGGVPLFAWVARPEAARATIVGTYGITGSLDNQWFLQILGQKAYAQGYAVILFDWRAHGKTAELSPTLTSDGLLEGADFLHVAAQAQQMGCPAPFWLTGFSLGGQLALWGVQAAQTHQVPEFDAADLGGAAVICPNLDSNRSLNYLLNHPLGRYLEGAIARQLKKLAWRLHDLHPGQFNPDAINRANTILGFDQELVIDRLGFATVADYYQASSPMSFLPDLQKPVLLLYAADDPMFDPTLIPDLELACGSNPQIDLWLTKYGGHVGYYSSRKNQHQLGDADPWWAWNRLLDWLDDQLPT